MRWHAHYLRHLSKLLPQHKSSSQHTRGAQLQFEQLEERSLFAVTSTITDSVLYVEGTAQDDTIEVRQLGSEILVQHSTRVDGRTVSKGIDRFRVTDLQSVVVSGRQGNDIIRSVYPAPRIPVILEGDEGPDKIDAVGLDATLVGGEGNDTMLARHDNAVASFSDSPNGVQVDLEAGLISADGYGTQDRVRGIRDVVGSTFDDTIVGNFRSNILYGLEGDDTLHGRKRAHQLRSNEPTAAVIEAGPNAYTEKDLLFGDAGKDVLIAGPSADTLMGGDGDDVVDAGDGDDVIDGGLGNDELRGGDGKDYINGNVGDDEIHAGSMNDIVLGFLGDDVLHGEDGSDFIDGGDGDDDIYGGSDEDILKGGLGENLIDGQGDDDLIIGGKESDQLTGGDGRDVLLGGLGNDVVSNGAGDGTIASDSTGDVVTSGNGVVHVINDADLPLITPEMSRATPLKVLLDTQYQQNAAVIEQKVMESKKEKAPRDKILFEARKRDGEVDSIEGAANKATEDFNRVQRRIEKLPNEAQNASESKLDALATELVELKKEIDELTMQAETGLGLGGVAGKIGGAISDGWKGAKDGFQGAADSFLEAGEQFGKSAAKKIVQALKDGGSAAKKLVNDVKQLTTDGIAKVENAVLEAREEISKEFGKAVQGINDFGVDLNQSAIKIGEDFEKIWTEKVKETLTGSPVLGGNAVDWFKGIVESPQRFADWWTEKVKNPFNNWWQEKVEPAWHDAEDGWHKFAQEVSKWDYADAFFESPEVSTIYVEPSGQEGFFIVETNLTKSGFDTNKPKLRVYTSIDEASDSAKEESNVTLQAGADGTSDRVKVNVRAQGRVSKTFTSDEFSFPVTKRIRVLDNRPEDDPTGGVPGNLPPRDLPVGSNPRLFISQVTVNDWSQDSSFINIHVESPINDPTLAIQVTVESDRGETKYDYDAGEPYQEVGKITWNLPTSGYFSGDVQFEKSTIGADWITVEIVDNSGFSLAGDRDHVIGTVNYGRSQIILGNKTLRSIFEKYEDVRLTPSEALFIGWIMNELPKGTAHALLDGIFFIDDVNGKAEFAAKYAAALASGNVIAGVAAAIDYGVEQVLGTSFTNLTHQLIGVEPANAERLASVIEDMYFAGRFPAAFAQPGLTGNLVPPKPSTQNMVFFQALLAGFRKIAN